MLIVISFYSTYSIVGSCYKVIYFVIYERCLKIDLFNKDDNFSIRKYIVKSICLTILSKWNWIKSLHCYLSIYLFVYPLSIYPLSSYLYHTYLSIYCLPIYLSIVYLFSYLSSHYLSIYILTTHLSIFCLPFYLSISLSI